MILEEATFIVFDYRPSNLKPHSSKPVLAACDNCGKVRETSMHHYHTLCPSCVQKCENNPNWRGGKVERICEQCGKKIECTPSDIERGGGKYCCCSCALKAQRHTARPGMTAPENVFKDICKKYLLPFKFVGDGTLWLGNANPDFIHNTKKIVVEVFGDYWHSPLLNKHVGYVQTLEGRRKQLKKEGYKCIFIWESDLKREDAEAFVMHVMRKEDII